MRRHAVAVTTPRPDAFDTCGTGGDGAGTFQHLVGGGAGRRGLWRERRQARQSIGVEPFGECRRVRGLGVKVAATPDVVERCLAQGGHRFLLRADVPSLDAACRAAPTGARHPHGLQPSWPAHQPGGRSRHLVGVPRPEMTELVARRWPCWGPSGRGSFTAPTASTRSRPAATRRCRSAVAGWCTRSTCTRPIWRAQGDRLVVARG